MKLWPFVNKEKQRTISVVGFIIGVYLLVFRPQTLSNYFDVFTFGTIVTFLALLYFFDAQ